MAIPVPSQEKTAKQIRSMNLLPQGREPYRYRNQFEPIYIYNIGKWAGENQAAFIRNSGTGHTFVIPLREPKEFNAADAGKMLAELDPELSKEELKQILDGVKAGLHSMPCLVPDPLIEFYPTRLGSPPKAETWEGKRIAQDITNLWPGDDSVSAGKNPNDDLRYWGVFIAKGKVPTKAEMDEVREWYMKRLNQLINEADDLARDNRFKEIQKIHRFALTERGLTRPWNKTAEEMSEPAKIACPFCM